MFYFLLAALLPRGWEGARVYTWVVVRPPCLPVHFGFRLLVWSRKNTTHGIKHCSLLLFPLNTDEDEKDKVSGRRMYECSLLNIRCRWSAPDRHTHQQPCRNVLEWLIKGDQ